MTIDEVKSIRIVMGSHMLMADVACGFIVYFLYKGETFTAALLAGAVAISVTSWWIWWRQARKEITRGE